MSESTEETLAGDTVGGMPHPPARGHSRGLRRGDQLGRYTVLELLGQGGMGLVYTAYDPQLDRRVAVKVLRARGTTSRNERARQRLLREAQAMAKLSHPNVVAVHDVGTVDDEVFIAMEFVDGAALDRWLAADPPRSWREVIAVFTAAGRGLAAAHEAGLVHRDFKPANVLIDRSGRARVTDFGLAHTAEPSSLVSGGAPSLDPHATWRPALTDADGLLGTPAYMAPEQHARLGVDARTDQFGFCVALYEALFGQHPFGGDTLMELTAAVSEGRAREVPSDSAVPAHVRRVVMRGLSHEPDERWASMDELLAALLDDPARRRMRWIGAAAIVGGLAGAVVLATRPAPPAPEPPPACEGAGDDIDAIWSPERRDAIARAFAATEQPHAATVWSRSATVIDDHAARWRGSARDACEATRVRGEQSDSLFDLRRACLDRRLHELDVRLELLGEVDAAMVDHGFELATSLTPIDVCEDAERLRSTVPRPEDPERAQQVSAVLEEIATLRASVIAGRTAEIVDEVDPLVARAVALDYAPVRAEARRLAAAVHEEVGHWPRAEALLMLAAEDAGEGRDDHQLAQIWSTAPHLVGYLQARISDAELLAPVARAALARAGRPDDLVVTFEQGMGSMRLRQGDRVSARAHYEAALRLLGNDDATALSRSRVLNNIGVLDMLDGDLDRARRGFEQAHTTQAALLRPDHPDNADYEQNLGNIATAQADFRGGLAHYDRALELLRRAQPEGGPGEFSVLINRSQTLASLHRLEEARADVERAQELADRLYGADHPVAYAVWASRARLELELGHLDQARTAIVQAIELGRAALGEDHHDVGLLQFVLGIIELKAGNHARATEMIDRALAHSEAGYGADHPQTAAILRWRGSIDLAEGNLVAARERLGKAVEILDRRHGDAQELARGRFDLARSLPVADHARALGLAQQARERLAADEELDEVAAIDAWLAAQG